MSRRTDPAWADVTPIAQDDGEDPVVSINYSPQFVETMDYFRAIVAADERSERALQLCADAIALNAANYTAWYYRGVVSESIGRDWAEELAYLDELGPDNPKNYQIWNYRKTCVGKLAAAFTPPRLSAELGFIEDRLKEDAKNYHGWAYRQWVVRHFGYWAEELPLTERLLLTDVKNNSAWNHRFLAVVATCEGGALSAERRVAEVEFALGKAGLEPNNDSPWYYALGFTRALPAALRGAALPDAAAEAAAQAAACARLLELCSALEAAVIEQSKPPCLQLLAAQGELLLRAGGVAVAEAESKYRELERLDAVRAQFWAWKRAQATQ